MSSANLFSRIGGTERCSQLGAGVRDFGSMIHRMIRFQTLAYQRFCSAHWPAPLTASGAAVARPSCLPSSANQLNLEDNHCQSCPIERPVRLAPGSSQLGSSTFLDSSTGVLGKGFRASLNQLTRRTGFSYLTARFPRSNDRRDSTFPRESSGRVASAIFPPFFRVSGTLQRPLACGSFSHRIRS